MILILNKLLRLFSALRKIKSGGVHESNRIFRNNLMLGRQPERARLKLNLREISQEQELLAPGHSLCPGALNRLLLGRY